MIPKEPTDDPCYVPGVVVEVRRKGGKLELHKRGEDGNWASQRR